MLERHNAHIGVMPADDGANQTLTLRGIISPLFLRWPVLLACLLLSLAAAGGYLLVAPPWYTATSLLLIENRTPDVLRDDALYREVTFDATEVESQIEVLRSDGVLGEVVAQLRLNEDPEFIGAERGYLGSVLSAITELLGATVGQEQASPEEMTRLAIAVLRSRLNIQRVGRTLVLQISATSRSAQKAAAISNAAAEAYIIDQMTSKFQATKQATTWLQSRIGELRSQVKSADEAVQDYRSRNRILDTERGSLDEQQLSEVVTQLVGARADTARARARLETIQSVERSDVPDATVTDALHSEIISRLRQEYLEKNSREAEWARRYGTNHGAVVQLRAELGEIQKAIRSELGRIAETYKSEYEIAKAREVSLENGLSEAVERNNRLGEARVDLRQLESTSLSIRRIFDTFQARFMDALQQQSFPTSNARVITPAAPPISPSSPRSGITLAFATILGLGFGGGMVFMLQALDRTLKTSSEAEQAIGTECLGILPRLETAPINKATGAAETGTLPNSTLAMNLGILRQVADAPFDRFTETLRSVKVSIDVASMTRETKIIGVISALPAEGKTTVAANLAQLLAHSGSRTLLIDCDLRNPALTRLVARGAAHGLIELLQGEYSFEETIWTDPVTSLLVVPSPLKRRVFHTAEIVASPTMAKFLEQSRREYDYIVLDLPPIAPVADTRAMAHLIDAFLLVVEWAQTNKFVVRETLDAAVGIRSKLAGVVLNKANPSVLRRMEAYSGHYYGAYYGSPNDASEEK